MSDFRTAVNVRKAFKKLGFNIQRSRKYGTQAHGSGQIIINRRELEPMKQLANFLPYAHQSATLRGLSAKLDDLIEFGVRGDRLLKSIDTIKGMDPIYREPKWRVLKGIYKSPEFTKHGPMQRHAAYLMRPKLIKKIAEYPY